MREPGGHTLLFADLSRMDYSEALSLQHDIVSALKSGWIRQGIVLLLEHFPVYTVGRGRDLKNLNVSRRFLRRIGIPVISVERGGDITYHGPGQIVVYPILDLKHLGLGVHQYIALLEQVMVSTAAEWGIAAKGGTEKRGVWCDDRKLGSLGISVSRGISFHGMALNVNVSLTPFQWIHPCGLQDVQITSMQRECGHTLSLHRVRAVLQQHFADLLARKPGRIEPDALAARIRAASG